MSDVFISYSQRDRDIIEKLAAVLEAHGFTVWWDYNLVGGTKFRQEINKELASASAVIVLWSAHSVVSDWVLDEAEEAKAAGKLVPIRLPNLDYRSVPLGFRSLQVELADQPERIVVALNALGLNARKQAPENVLDDYWGLLARRTKPPGFLSRRTFMTAVAGGAAGVAATVGYRWFNAKRYLVRERAIHQGPITAVAALPDGKSVITAGEDGAVVVSNLLTGAVETRFESTGSAVTSVAYSQNHKTAYCTHRDGSVRAINLERKTTPVVSDLRNGAALKIQLVATANDRVAAVLTENGDVLRCAYDESAVKVQTIYKIGAKAICATHAPFLTGTCVVAYAKGASADVIALDDEGGRSLAFVKQDLSAHDGPITQIQTIVGTGSRAGGRYMYSFTASEDATIRCGDHYSRQMLYSLAGHIGSVTSLAVFSGSSRTTLASSGQDRTLKLWDTAEKRLIKDFDDQPAMTTSLAFTTNGLGLVSGREDGRLQFWDLSELPRSPA